MIDIDLTCTSISQHPMHSTSRKVKISVVSPTGQVQSNKATLSQIRLARIAQPKARSPEQELNGL